MSENHPVWEVYDLFRTSKLNEKYFGRRLDKYIKFNRIMDLIVAATTSTSAIASLAIWGEGIGREVWQILLFIAAFISVAKPILGVTNKVREYEEVLSGYRTLSYDLMQLRINISTERNYSDIHKYRFKEIMDKHSALITKVPEYTENRKTKLLCEKEVLTAYPHNSFFIPLGENNVQK